MDLWMCCGELTAMVYCPICRKVRPCKFEPSAWNEYQCDRCDRHKVIHERATTRCPLCDLIFMSGDRLQQMARMKEHLRKCQMVDELRTPEIATLLQELEKRT